MSDGHLHIGMVYFCMNRILFGLLFGLSTLAAVAQTAPTGISVTYPSSRAVFQRDNDNTSTIYLSGSYYQPIDSLQARLIPEVNGQGISTPWVTVRRSPQGGVFQGAIRGTGGWYRLEVQAFQAGRVVAQDVVRRVGIGEVFVITGQSNAQGLNDPSGAYVPGNNSYGAVGADDDRVNCVSYNNIEASSLADPPAPVFEQLSAATIIGPRGITAWCWGRLGDLIARQYNVPVLFMNTAWGATTIKNWVESANNQRTCNIYNSSVCFPEGMPYANLRIALRYYASLQGLRAILWHQGETDNIPLRVGRDEYRNLMQQLINRTRQDTDRYPAWVLARASRTGIAEEGCRVACKGDVACENRCPTTTFVSDAITGAQTDIVGTFGNNVYPGPFTDNVQPNRPDRVHFSGQGLLDLANAWYQSMSPTFFSGSLPLLPQAQPTLTVECAGNNALTIRASSTFPIQSYIWSNGQTGSSITVNQAGQYQVKVKNPAGNTFLSPTVDVRTPVAPTTPTVSLARSGTSVADNQQQVCADSVLTLVANVGTQSTAQWSNGVAGTTLRVGNVGTYSVRAINTYGCQSAQSSGINLTVRPRLATPSIEQVGIYSLQATLPGFPNNERFDWRRGTVFLNNQDGPVAKVVQSGTYTARAKAVFTLPNSNALTCFSNFSNEVVFTTSELVDGVSVYPNPSVNGFIAVETLEDLQDADLTIHSLTGQLLYSEKVPSFSTRRLIPVAGFASGQYIVRIKSATTTVSRRVFIAR
jgi:hypothetical protein